MTSQRERRYSSSSKASGLCMGGGGDRLAVVGVGWRQGGRLCSVSRARAPWPAPPGTALITVLPLGTRTIAYQGTTHLRHSTKLLPTHQSYIFISSAYSQKNRIVIDYNQDFFF